MSRRQRNAQTRRDSKPATSRWNDPDKFCPTCGDNLGRCAANALYIKGHTVRVKPLGRRRGLAPSTSLRVHWAERIRQARKGSIMGRTYLVCPDPYHSKPKAAEPEAAPKGWTGPPDKADIETRSKRRSKQHKNHQGKDRR